MRGVLAAVSPRTRRRRSSTLLISDLVESRHLVRGLNLRMKRNHTSALDAPSNPAESPLRPKIKRRLSNMLLEIAQQRSAHREDSLPLRAMKLSNIVLSLKGNVALKNHLKELGAQHLLPVSMMRNLRGMSDLQKRADALSGKRNLLLPRKNLNLLKKKEF